MNGETDVEETGGTGGPGTAATSATSGSTTSPPTGSGPGTTANATTADTEQGGTTTSSGTGPTSGTEGDDTSSSSGASFACDAGAACVPATPTDWLGPVAVARGGATVSACPDAFPTEVLDAFEEVTAAPAQCGCSCGNAVGLSCGAAILTESGSSCIVLPMNPQSFTIPLGVCQPISGTNDTSWRGTPGTLNTASASCEPGFASSVPAAVTDGALRACLSDVTGDACEGDGTCVAPDEDFAEICIYREGVFACPAGGFSERRLVYTGFTDDRACSECTCGTPTGQCDGNITLANSNCVFADGSVATPGCSNVGIIPEEATYNPTPNATCAASGGASNGTTDLTGARTVCCAP